MACDMVLLLSKIKATIAILAITTKIIVIIFCYSYNQKLSQPAGPSVAVLEAENRIELARPDLQPREAASSQKGRK